MRHREEKRLANGRELDNISMVLVLMDWGKTRGDHNLQSNLGNQRFLVRSRSHQCSWIVF